MNVNLRHSPVMAAVCLAALLGMSLSCIGFDEHSALPLGKLPTIRPDYSNSVIPPNIAPLNFTISDSGDAFAVRISSIKGPSIFLTSASPDIVIPPWKWHRLLKENAGNELSFHMYINRKGQWNSFSPIANRIASERIDQYITYRLTYPQFYMKNRLEIWQRDLESFKERLIISPKDGCFNCHTFYNHSTDKFLFQARFYGKNYMVLHNQGKTSLITPVLRKPGSAYASWHPSGNLVALLMDTKVSVFPFVAGRGAEEVLEYTDLGGDIGVYDVRNNTVSTTPALSQPDRMETQPAWSPDGKYLYFVSCPIVPKKEFLNVKYDLQRIGFDAEHGTWSDVETLVSAKETGLGCTFPTLSPDNKFLLFCMTDRGSFSIVRQSTDLYIMDLEKKSFKKLDINSDHSDSYHGWSSNGRWIIFTSKRTDGIFGKFFISYVDSSGNVHKPLLLPQHNPRFYDTFTKSFQRAEFTTAPFKENPAYLNDIIGDTGRVIIASYR